MNTLLLTASILGVAFQQICTKEYDKKVANGVFSFSAAAAVFAMLVFIPSKEGFLSISPALLIYSLLFSFSYTLSTVALFLSLHTGSLSLTSLITSYSLIIPSLYGILVLGEETSATLFLGIGLLLVSLFLINCEGKKEEGKITFKWIIYVTLTFLGNGACSTIQRVQQLDYNGLYKNEFMFISLIITALSLFIFAMFSEKKNLGTNLKKGFVWYTMRGIANGLVNLFVIILALRMPASVSFPIISAGGIITSAAISVFGYKEKLSLPQIFGLILGTLAIIVLNI